MLWLDASTPDVFPPGLYDALLAYLPLDKSLSREERLRRQMQADALQPLDDAGEQRVGKEEAPSEEDIRDAAEFLAHDVRTLCPILPHCSQADVRCPLEWVSSAHRAPDANTGVSA